MTETPCTTLSEAIQAFNAYICIAAGKHLIDSFKGYVSAIGLLSYIRAFASYCTLAPNGVVFKCVTYRVCSFIEYSEIALVSLVLA